jgi:hypothetical protein
MQTPAAKKQAAYRAKKTRAHKEILEMCKNAIERGNRTDNIHEVQITAMDVYRIKELLERK